MGGNYSQKSQQFRYKYKYYSQQQMNWRAKSLARLEVFMGVLLYVNIRREDTSPETVNRCID